MTPRRDEIQVIAEPLGGSPLSQLVQANHDAPWIVRRPATPDEWRDWVEQVRRSAPSWREKLAGAFDARGAARARLDRVAAAGGVVVTTGQQPGLFGGALYTWNKAISALELADAIERVTGVPAAPVFWAATDDADFAEAAFTWLRTADGARRVEQQQPPSDGEPLAEVPLDGVEDALLALRDAVGSAADLEPVQAVQETYVRGATIGSAYLALMRRLLEPLGIAVIDGSHPSLLEAERPLMVRALERAPAVYTALEEREKLLVGAGYRPQVTQVPDLSLVFSRAVRKKTRVPLAKAAEVAARASRESLSPNVLLRPVVERSLLPSVAYMAGPGELAYFAQASAVAEALGVPAPLGVPRWGCTVLEPDAMEIAARYNIDWRALADAHRIEQQIARAAVPADVLAELESMRATVRAEADGFKALLEQHGKLLDPRVVDGAARGMSFRVDRLERRLLAAAKRREATTLREISVARGSLFPGGQRQERALNFVPLLARHGAPLADAMRQSARRHAEALMHGRSLPANG
jgi:bacillithiol biosynthesis cysteine-adding enzyme BshC